MTDSGREQEQEKEDVAGEGGDELYNHDIHSRIDDNSNDHVTDIINSREEPSLGEEYLKSYERYLYSLLPAIYQEFDTKQNNALQEFLKIIASPAAAIRRDIDGLLNNFFINSCEDWVIPYIGDLIAAKAIPNSSFNSRLDVQKTIHWRKLKGTQIGLIDLIRNTTGADASVKEAFRYCSSCQHLGFSKNSENISRSSSNFVDLRDQSMMNNIGMENDVIPHLIDVREPTHANGWYNIKNLLIFLPQLKIYHIDQAESEKNEDGDRIMYYFSSLASNHISSQRLSSSSFASNTYIDKHNNNDNNNKFQLYDYDTSLRIKSTEFAQNPYHYFGHKRGMAIRISNILAACLEPPNFTPVKLEDSKEVLLTISSTMTTRRRRRDYDSNSNSSNNASSDDTDPDFIGLHKEEGIRLLELRKFDSNNKHFIIRVYSYSNEDQNLTEIANYDTSKIFSEPYQHLLIQKSRSKKIPFGTILVSVEPSSQSLTAASTVFPETSIAIRDSQRFLYVRETTMDLDNRTSKYKNALYVYLPAISLNPGERKYLFVDHDGSTYYEKRRENEQYGNVRLKGELARRACGQIFPPRRLTYSLEHLKKFADLNRYDGIKVADPKKYEKSSSLSSSFDIEAIAIDKKRDQAWSIGRRHITADGSSEYTNEKEVWIRWTIQTANDSNPSSNENHSSLEQESVVCHFKATRIVFDENHAVHRKKVDSKRLIRDIMPREIVPENSTGDGTATYQIGDEKPVVHLKNDDKSSVIGSNAFEIEVKVDVDPRFQVNEITEKIRNAIQETSELNDNNNNEAELVLRISSNTDYGKDKNLASIFPLSEIILTNSFGKSMLVYLPQLIFGTRNSKYFLYIASDGSTSFEEDLSISARESAGQVIPIAGRYPLQQRVPVFVNLANAGQSSMSVRPGAVYSGELAVDPEHGRFAFSRQDNATESNKEDDNVDDGPLMRVTADYNYAFSDDLGAGTYDRRADLKKATKWVSKMGHVHYVNALPSKTYQTVVDALASAEDDDVIQIEDCSIYRERASISSLRFQNTVRNVTLQAADQMMPTIKLTKGNRTFRAAFNYDESKSGNYRDRAYVFNLNGVLITGGPIMLEGDFDRLVLTSCTIDPGYDDKRFSGVEVNSSASSSQAADSYSTTAKTGSTLIMKDKSLLASNKEITLNRTVCGSIIVDESVSRISMKDSIIDNIGGSAIEVKSSSEGGNGEPTLKLEAERSNILSNPRDEPMLELKDICCSDVIFTGRVKVTVSQDDDQSQSGNSNDNKTTRRTFSSYIRYSRYGQGSVFNIKRRNRNDIEDFSFRCTVGRPIFLSTTFGDSTYMHLDHMTSKSILEGAQNTLEMGSFNTSDKPLYMRNLKIRLHEFLPIGVKSGLVFLY